MRLTFPHAKAQLAALSLLPFGRGDVSLSEPTSYYEPPAYLKPYQVIEGNRIIDKPYKVIDGKYVVLDDKKLVSKTHAPSNIPGDFSYIKDRRNRAIAEANYRIEQLTDSRALSLHKSKLPNTNRRCCVWVVSYSQSYRALYRILALPLYDKQVFPPGWPGHSISLDLGFHNCRLAYDLHVLQTSKSLATHPLHFGPFDPRARANAGTASTVTRGFQPWERALIALQEDDPSADLMF